MLRIRLQRTGSKNDPTYRIVVAEKRAAAKGKSVEVIGHFLPSRTPNIFELKKDRLSYWLSKGATPTDTMARLFAKNGVKGQEKYMQRYSKQRSKSAEPEAPAAAAPKAEAAPVEAPKEGGDTPEKQS